MQLSLSLIKATYWYDDALKHGLSKFGVPSLSRAQSFVIADIVAGEHRASAIAKNLGVSRQAISQILIELTKRGLVQVTDDPSSARARFVELSPDFEAKAQICAELYEKIEQELARRIGAAELEALKTVLDADWGEPPQFDDDIDAMPEMGSEHIPLTQVCNPEMRPLVEVHRSTELVSRKRRLKTGTG